MACPGAQLQGLSQGNHFGQGLESTSGLAAIMDADLPPCPTSQDSAVSELPPYPSSQDPEDAGDEPVDVG